MENKKNPTHGLCVMPCCSEGQCEIDETCEMEEMSEMDFDFDFNNVEEDNEWDFTLEYTLEDIIENSDSGLMDVEEVEIGEEGSMWDFSLEDVLVNLDSELMNVEGMQEEENWDIYLEFGGSWLIESRFLDDVKRRRG